MKRNLKALLMLVLVMAMIITTSPTAMAAPQTKDDNNQKELYSLSTETNKYLVLVGQKDGSYLAYEDLTSVIDGHIMIKAKPLAKALGLYYQNKGEKGKKGCSISLNFDMIVFTQNSDSYKFYDYIDTTKKIKSSKRTADYKQVFSNNENYIPFATLGNLVNSSYYDTTNNTNYKYLGYTDVIVYNKYNAVTDVPVLSKVTNLNNNPWFEEAGGIKKGNILSLKLSPMTVIKDAFEQVKYIEATYQNATTTTDILLDLSAVLTAFKDNGYPSDGIYGYGYSNSSIKVRAYDSQDSFIGEYYSDGGEFPITFPGASQIKVKGNTKNLVLDFTPVKPIVITGSNYELLSHYNWIYGIDKIPRQYFILADHMKLKTVGLLDYAYNESRLMLDPTYKDAADTSTSFQRITLTYNPKNFSDLSAKSYLSTEKTNRVYIEGLAGIENTGRADIGIDYVTKLSNLISTIRSLGTQNYYPSSNWNRFINMKLIDDTPVEDYTQYIRLDKNDFGLDYFTDYYHHSFEIARYYESTTLYYGLNVEAWSIGNAANLARRTLDHMNIYHYNSTNGKDFIEGMYDADNFKFLSVTDRANFENYYMEATGIHAAIVGYHFNKFLQDMYGADIIFKIMQRVNAANIPISEGKSTASDTIFANCIKNASSQTVFQDFIRFSIK
ncbi:MAG: hypothetical protein K0R34_252 [Herbinix sp.]|jgi:hypothetical protein|nr:hypothetical protein [Herbinix sp.]